MCIAELRTDKVSFVTPVRSVAALNDTHIERVEAGDQNALGYAWYNIDDTWTSN